MGLVAVGDKPRSMSAGYTKTIEALQAKSAEGERRRIAKAIELAMKSGASRRPLSGRACASGLFYARGDGAIYAERGLEKQIKAIAEAGRPLAPTPRCANPVGDEGHEGRHALVFAGDIMIELAELEDKKGNVRVAMLAATSDVPVGTLLIAFEEAQKR